MVKKYTTSAYSEKLKDPRWQKLRLEIFERDKWECQICYATDKTLHVHHLHYLKGREPWEYADEMQFLLTVCCDCHEVESASLQDAKDTLFARLADHGLLTSEWLTQIGDTLYIAGYMNDVDRMQFISSIDGFMRALEESFMPPRTEGSHNPVGFVFG